MPFQPVKRGIFTRISANKKKTPRGFIIDHAELKDQPRSGETLMIFYPPRGAKSLQPKASVPQLR